MSRVTWASSLKLHENRTFMPTFTQTRRVFTVSSPLGEKVLLLTAFDGREGNRGCMTTLD